MTNKLKLLLCTDMDRTVIPNGSQPEHPKAREVFRKLCVLPGVELVYVTGRHLQLVQEAVEQYALPQPTAIISDVGTRIYLKDNQTYNELALWQDHIAQDWHGRSTNDLQQALDNVADIKLQEEGKQSDFKLSYYFPLESDEDSIMTAVKKQLDHLGVSVNLITSIDEAAHIGLLDILPVSADKLHGLNFLRNHLGYSADETIFAGDSGNDLPVLESSIYSVLVANASSEIKKQAIQLAISKGNQDSFYQAENDYFSLGGNYSAGVIQGVIHYMPQIELLLEGTL